MNRDFEVLPLRHVFLNELCSVHGLLNIRCKFQFVPVRLPVESGLLQDRPGTVDGFSDECLRARSGVRHDHRQSVGKTADGPAAANHTPTDQRNALNPFTVHRSSTPILL